MALVKGIAIGDVLSYDQRADTFTLHVAGMLGMLGQLAPHFVRLELRLAGYGQWDARLVAAYAEVLGQLKSVPTQPTIIAEITQQSVPGATQAVWNAGHTEQATVSAGQVTPFTAQFADVVDAIVQTPTGPAGGTLCDFIQHWEIWNEPNAATWQNKDGHFR